MILHTPTVFVLLVTASTTMAVALAAMALRRHRDLGLFEVALALNACAYVLLGLRGQIGDALSIVGGNIAFSAALALFCESVFRFLGQRPPRLLLWGPVVLTALGYGLLMDTPAPRVLLSGLFATLQFGVTLVALWRRRHETGGRGQYILATGMAAVLGITGLRALAVLGAGWMPLSMTRTEPAQSWGFVIAVAALLLIATGLVVMTQERTERALRAGQDRERFRSHVLDRMSGGAELPALLEEIARGAERLCPDSICTIALDGDAGSPPPAVVAPGLPAALHEALGRDGPCADAARERRCVLLLNVQQRAPPGRYRDAALAAGVAASWCQPVLTTRHGLLGVLALHLARPLPPDAQEAALIEGLAQLVGVAVERSTDARALRASERQYRLLIESATDGICVLQDEALRYVNPQLRTMLGRDEWDLLGQPLLRFVHPDDRVLVEEHLVRQLRGEADEARYPVRLLTRHRGTRWAEITGVRFEWQGVPATLELLTDITERRATEERVHELAYHDALTGLPNRRLLRDRLRMTVAANRRSGRHAALVFLDLDNFKPLNDRHGHVAGDLLLAEVAERLRACVRETDTVARYGGDEFVLLLTELDDDEPRARAQAAQIADKALRRIAEPFRLHTGQHGAANSVEHRCSASAGVRLFVAPDAGAEDDDALLDQADAAMYRAKKAGCNTMRFHAEPVA